jgi:hypothetical protein
MSLQEWAMSSGLKRIGLVLAVFLFILGLLAGGFLLWWM